jgi:hypothetical protein
MAANGLGIILFRYADWLLEKGYSRGTIHLYTQALEHFGFWRAKHHAGSQSVQTSDPSFSTGGVGEPRSRSRTPSWSKGLFKDRSRKSDLQFVLSDVLHADLKFALLLSQERMDLV